MKYSIIGSLLVLSICGQAHAADPRSAIGTFNSGNWYLDMDNSYSWTSADEIHHLGSAGEQPYVISESQCALPGVTAAIGTVHDGNHWFLSKNDLDWDNSSDPLNDFFFGVSPMKPAIWNGVPVAFMNGTFYVDWNGDHVWDNGDATLPFGGNNGMYPVVGIWTTNGTERLGMYDPSSNWWFVDSNNSNSFDSGDARYHFGFSPSDIPVVIFFNQTFSSRIGVFNSGNWYIDANGNGKWDGTAGGDAQWQLGNPGDVPVVATYNRSWRSKGCDL